MKYPSDRSPSQAPPSLHHREPALVSGILHYPAPPIHASSKEAAPPFPAEPAAPLAVPPSSAFAEAPLRPCIASPEGASVAAARRAAVVQACRDFDGRPAAGRYKDEGVVAAVVRACRDPDNRPATGRSRTPPPAGSCPQVALRA